MLLPRSFLASAIALLASSDLIQHVAAQVTTDCQPLNVTNCPADPAFGMDHTFHFNSTPTSSTWETTVGTVNYDATNGASFTINKQGDSPTIRSKFYFFGGRTEIHMKAATGQGIISSVMFLSDDLDEIDWEFMGTKGDIAATNYFGKGQPDFKNGKEHTVAGGVQNDYHNYTTLWTKDSLLFYIDGQLVRTLLPQDAVRNGTSFYPQTPMRLSIGIWAGGDPRLAAGTREWAGGDTDYSKGPFTMHVKSAQIADFSSGKEYTYGDKSGSWESIKIVAGNSTIKDEMNAQPAPSVSDKWNALSPTAKIAIYASASGFAAILFFWALFYCIRQRRRGAREAKLAEARANEERMELDRFRKAGVDPDSFVDEASEYNAKEMAREGLSGKDGYSITPTGNTSPVNEKWETAAALGAGAGGAAAAGNMRSPMPLLRDGAQSPRINSPAAANAPYSDRASPAPSSVYNAHDGTRSPPPPKLTNIRAPAPGMGGPASQFSQQPPARSFSSPSAQMRTASPGLPGQAAYGRVGSPAQVAQPQPQRSFTTGGYQQPSHQTTAYGSPPNSQNQVGYGQGGGYSNGASEGYWGNGGYR
ncbi:glycoside hydrolase family 16 protein [Cercophora scortea]|uniref:chitinase n=1 Tax=Cercophora scortea TaxID=314031 RepID=A0AAE0J724_9PEZI|nr:glycoside hydrolase family 16 protein [Cercophora scortea]